MHKSRPTQNKRARERAQADRRKLKLDRRLQAKSRRTAVSRTDGEDPDIAGIRPGPQPNPYGDEPMDDASDEEPR